VALSLLESRRAASYWSPVALALGAKHHLNYTNNLWSATSVPTQSQSVPTEPMGQQGSNPPRQVQ